MSTETYFEVFSHPYRFHAYVLNQHGNITVKFGGKKSCVEYVFHEDEENPILRGVSFDDKCTVENLENPNKGLLPGAGTVTMLKASIYFIYKIWPRKGDIELKDSSWISCAERDRYGASTRMPLHILYLFKHQKTWYQDKVGAVLVNKQAAETLSKYISFVKEPKNKLPFRQFVETYLPEGTISHRKRNEIVKDVESLYGEHKSYAGFLKAVATSLDCSKLVTWGTIFFQKHCNIPIEMYDWTISAGLLSIGTHNVIVKQIVDKPGFAPNIYAGGGMCDKNNELHIMDAW
jgi:hypothetical protein